ncbi:MAG: hypothetical protein V3T23_03165 [Nitrososphaerales archaeon]
MSGYNPDGDTEFQLAALLNQGLTVQDNFNWGILEVILASGVNTLQHGLGFIPSGYIMIYSEDPITLSAPSLTSWTKEQILLTSSAASPKVRLFVV